jgi:hypothetical protein
LDPILLSLDHLAGHIVGHTRSYSLVRFWSATHAPTTRSKGVEVVSR